MPKRANASSAASAKRAKGTDEHVCVLRWARCTDVDSLDHEKIQEMEWAGRESGDLIEIHACIKEELESVLKDEHGTDGAFLSRESALQARDELMKRKIQEAREAVRHAFGQLSPVKWKQLLKSDWVCEYSDTQAFDVDYKGPGHHDLAWCWAHRSSAIEAAAAAFTFHDAQHHINDPLQAHYELAWGSLEGCDVCKGFEANDMIECCETILTRIRCWVELVSLKD
jgi:hypothetical protein